MKRIKITAARWHQKTDSGYIHHRTGDVIEVTDREAERLITAGAATPSKAKLTDPDTEATPAKDDPETDTEADDAPVEDIIDDLETPEEQPEPQGPIEKPKATDITEVWQEYAISQGMPEDEAKALNRTELRKHYS